MFLTNSCYNHIAGVIHVTKVYRHLRRKCLLLFQNINCISKFMTQSQACEYLTELCCVYSTTQSHHIFSCSPRVQERKHPSMGINIVSTVPHALTPEYKTTCKYCSMYRNINFVMMSSILIFLLFPSINGLICQTSVLEENTVFSPFNN